MIKNSGEKILSINFEFNEPFDILGPSDQPENVKNKWIIANSLHVIDSAYPVGLPDIERSFFYQYGGNLKWHPSEIIFMALVKPKRSLFSYNAIEWTRRWWFEWVTKTTRYIFKPMEQLVIRKRFQRN